MNNIFQIGGQVSGESFIGRKEFINAIRNSFLNDVRTCKSIVGLTRIGKSSAIKNSFIDLPENCIFIYEDLNEWSSYNELWQDICYEIKEKIYSHCTLSDELCSAFENMESEELPWIKMCRSVKRIFEYLNLMKIKTILVLDEFDNASSLFSEGTKQFELFRTIFSDSKYNVSAITISRRNLYTIEGATYQSSTFHGVLDVVHFKGFEEDDIKEYFDAFCKYGIILDDLQKEKILYYAGNIPYLLSIMGHYIIESFLNNEDINIDEIFFSKCKAINDYYRDCIMHLERDDDLKRIIPFVIGPNIGVTQIDKEELFNLGYFRMADSKLVVISEYFNEFLSINMMGKINIWDSIISLEKKIKNIIEREMCKIVEHYSPAASNLNEIFRYVLEHTPGIRNGDVCKYNNYMANSKEKFGRDASYLEMISMADSIKIIRECWGDIFSLYFSGDLYSKWEMKLNKCAGARNPIAHGTEYFLSESEVEEVEIYCKQILETISFNYNKITLKDHNYISDAQKNREYPPKEIEYDKPISGLVGTTKEMIVWEIGKNNNLYGVLDNKYRAVITKNTIDVNLLTDYLYHKYVVSVQGLNNGMYEVKIVN